MESCCQSRQSVGGMYMIHKQVSDLFSATEVPLIFQVILMLEDMEHELEKSEVMQTCPT